MTSEVIKAVPPLLFNFPITFYDDSKLTDFEEKWIRHFFMREIGLESVDYFLLRLQDKFDTIMPYYNKLFKTVETEFNPLINEIIDETVEFTKDDTSTTNDENTVTNNGNSTLTNTTKTTDTAENTHTASDYPQSELTNFQDNSFLSKADKNDSSGTTDSTVTGSNESESTTTSNSQKTETTNGKTNEIRKANNTRGNQSRMLRDYYSAIKNITEQFYDECEDLFMQLWL